MLVSQQSENNNSTANTGTDKIIELVNDIFDKPNDKLNIHFQPIVNYQKKIIAVEALTSIPQNHIHIQNIINNLQQANNHNALQRLQLLIIACGLKQNQYPQIWFNVTPDACENNTFIDVVIEMCKYFQRKKQLIIGMEITERCITPLNQKKLEKNIEKLKNARLKVIMDDFGTEYSNMHNLITYDWDILKINGNIIKQIQPYSKIDQQKKAEAILKCIFEMSHKINVRAVAEWVENDYQFHILKNLGCHYFQGFLFGSRTKPITIPPFIL